MNGNELSREQMTKRIEHRLHIWEVAAEKVAPIVETHGLKEQIIGSIVATAYKDSAVSQHISAIMVVADWLLSEED